MSRSYKKTGAYSYAGSGNKWCRSQYHRGERKNAKAALNTVRRNWFIDKELEGKLNVLASDCFFCEVTNFGRCDIPYDDYMDEEYNPDTEIFWHVDDWEYYWEKDADKILAGKGRNIDYSLKMADRWCWTSDGGAWCESTKG